MRRSRSEQMQKALHNEIARAGERIPTMSREELESFHRATLRWMLAHVSADIEEDIKQSETIISIQKLDSLLAAVAEAGTSITELCDTADPLFGVGKGALSRVGEVLKNAEESYYYD